MNNVEVFRVINATLSTCLMVSGRLVLFTPRQMSKRGSKARSVVRNWHAYWLRWLSSSFSAAALFDALLRRLPRSILFPPPPPAGPPCCFCFSASSTYLSRVAPMARHLASSKNQIPCISVSLVLNNRNGGLVCLSSSAVRGWTQLLGLKKTVITL